MVQIVQGTVSTSFKVKVYGSSEWKAKAIFVESLEEGVL